MNKSILKRLFIENVYPYSIFSSLTLYWIYSTEWIYNQSIELQITPWELVMVTGFYAIIVTSSLLVVYYSTKDDFMNWLESEWGK
jgi:hypothetical protein